jgi:hypothetical protein
MTHITRKHRQSGYESVAVAGPLGMGEPPRPEIIEGILRRDAQLLEQALARIPEADLPRVLGVALARRFGRDKGRRIADLAVVHAFEA